jgi:hypothetical protein
VAKKPPIVVKSDKKIKRAKSVRSEANEEDAKLLEEKAKKSEVPTKSNLRREKSFKKETPNLGREASQKVDVIDKIFENEKHGETTKEKKVKRTKSSSKTLLTVPGKEVATKTLATDKGKIILAPDTPKDGTKKTPATEKRPKEGTKKKASLTDKPKEATKKSASTDKAKEVSKKTTSTDKAKELAKKSKKRVSEGLHI